MEDFISGNDMADMEMEDILRKIKLNKSDDPRRILKEITETQVMIKAIF